MESENNYKVELDTYSISTQLNKSNLFLLYIAKTCNIDYTVLSLLADKYKEDIFYFFYMFAGKKLTLPSPSKMNKHNIFIDKVMTLLTDNNLVVKEITEDSKEDFQQNEIALLPEESEFYSYLLNYINIDTKIITYPLDIQIDKEDI